MCVQLEKKTIYEIFRSCRLCGAGDDGFKMPIVQSSVGFDISDITLRLKIKECLQLEVQEEDRMPPLICERCIEKLNLFYDFQKLCHEVNKKTRIRLGLPMQTVNTGSTTREDCILGDTDPVYIKGRTVMCSKPGPKSKKMLTPQPVEGKPEKSIKEIQEEMNKKVEKVKEEEGKKISALQKEIESLKKQLTAANKQAATLRLSSDSRESRDGRPLRSRPIVVQSSSPSVTSRSSSMTSPQRESVAPQRESRALRRRYEGSSRSPSTSSKASPPPPPRETRRSGGAVDTPKMKPKIGPKSVLQRDSAPVVRIEIERNNDSLLMIGKKRSREVDQLKMEAPASKKPKVTLKPPMPSPPPSRPGPRSRKLMTPPLSQLQTKPQPATRTQSASKTQPDSKPQPELKVQLSRQQPTTKPQPSKPLPTTKPQPSKPQPTTKPQPSKPQPTTKPQPSKPQPTTKPQPSKPQPTTKPQPSKLQPTTKSQPKLQQASGRFSCDHCEITFKSLPAVISHKRHHHADFIEQPATDMKPEVECEYCGRAFATIYIKNHHRCTKSATCPKCSRTLKHAFNLPRHLKTCKGLNDVKIPSHVRRGLRNVLIRTQRCDAIVGNKRRVDIVNVSPTFGLHKRAIYPYFPYNKVPIKREPLSLNNMVSIRQEIQMEFYKEEDYVHWDSDVSTDSEDEFTNETKKRKVDSLTALSLKTLFSKQCLGKVPKRLRKVKTDMFDPIINDSEFKSGIDSIIDNLDSTIDEDEATGVAKSGVSDCFSDVQTKSVDMDKNDGFDSDTMLEETDKSLLEANFDNLLKSNDNDVSKNDDDSNKNDDVNYSAFKAVNFDLNDDHSESPSCLNEASNDLKSLDDLNNDETRSNNINFENVEAMNAKNSLNDDFNSNFSTEATNGSVETSNTDDFTEAERQDTNSKADDSEWKHNDDETSNGAKMEGDDDGTANGEKTDNEIANNANDDYDNSQSTNVTDYDDTDRNDNGHFETTNGNNETEIDSKALLDELDAQIGEGPNIDGEYEKEKDENNKFVSDFVKDKNVSEYDSISDTEFNFDL